MNKDESLKIIDRYGLCLLDKVFNTEELNLMRKKFSLCEKEIQDICR